MSNLHGKFGYNGLDGILLRLLDEKFLDHFEMKQERTTMSIDTEEGNVSLF